MRKAGYSASDLRAAGVSLAQLKAGGYSLCDLKIAGFSGFELKAAGFSIQGYTLATLKTEGFTALDLKDLGWNNHRQLYENFSLTELAAAFDMNYLKKQVRCDLYFGVFCVMAAVACMLTSIIVSSQGDNGGAIPPAMACFIMAFLSLLFLASYCRKSKELAALGHGTAPAGT